MRFGSLFPCHFVLITRADELQCAVDLVIGTGTLVPRSGIEGDFDIWRDAAAFNDFVVKSERHFLRDIAEDRSDILFTDKTGVVIGVCLLAG